MRINWLNKIITSVFTKLLVVILLTGICVNLIVGGFFWVHRSMIGRPLHQNIVLYLNYLIDDLGSPPSLERARQIATQSSLQILYEGPDASWSTAEVFSGRHQAYWRVWQKNPQIRVARYRGRYFVQIQHNGGRFIFAPDKQFDQDPERNRLVMILLSLLTLILAGAYLSIRWILKPVKWLNEGVREVAQGNLKHRVPLKRSDELRDLAAAFNDMTDRIRDMLRTKEQLLLDVSHELRSPLTRMKVALEFLPDGQAKSSIQSDVAEMEKMVDEILQTARRHHLQGKVTRQPVNLVALLGEVLPDFEKQPPGVSVEDVPPEVVIHIDPEQIKIVLRNILTNAVKFSGTGSDPVRISLISQPPHVVVRIADKGIGIPPDELPFIFEPFYRVDKSRSKHSGGFGLGLSLCKTIMEAHGGSIEIESTPNIGTAVSLIFPAPPTD